MKRITQTFILVMAIALSFISVPVNAKEQQICEMSAAQTLPVPREDIVEHMADTIYETRNQ